MGMTKQKIDQFIKEYNKEITKIKTKNKIMIFPAYTQIEQTKKLKNVEIGAQNVNENPDGAHTGEISIQMIKDLEIKNVLIGHSERRHIYKEDQQQIDKKVEETTKEMKIIYCVGETEQEKKENKTKQTLKKQLNIIKKLNEKQKRNITIAYEPVWAIGTGKTPTPEEVEEINNYIDELCGISNLNILYGGSINPENSKKYLEKKNISGVLIGGASLNSKKFIEIIKSI